MPLLLASCRAAGRQEIAKLLPLFMQAAVKLNSEIKKCVFLLPLASTLTEDEIKEHCMQR